MFKNTLVITVSFHFKIRFGFYVNLNKYQLNPGVGLSMPIIDIAVHVFKPFSY